MKKKKKVNSSVKLLPGALLINVFFGWNYQTTFKKLQKVIVIVL